MISCSSLRNFGVEIELNSFDFRPVTSAGNVASGSHYVANLIAKTLKRYVEVRSHGMTVWQDTSGFWVVKPDNSCGIEVCSPILSGWTGLKSVLQVVDAFGMNGNIKADHHCSLHVHIDVEDLNLEERANIIRWWIRTEPIFLNMVADSRRNNRFCQFVGLWDELEVEKIMDDKEIIALFESNKYNSINMNLNGRETLEFRIGDNRFCRNAYYVKNWIKLLLHFVETSKNIKPENLAWLDLEDFLVLMKFNQELSLGMSQVKNWVLAKMVSESNLDGFLGILSGLIKKKAQEKIDFDCEEAICPIAYRDALYNKIYSN